MIKHIITKVKRVSLFGDMCATEDGFYYPYVGSKIYVKLFGVVWIRYGIVNLKGKNH